MNNNDNDNNNNEKKRLISANYKNIKDDDLSTVKLLVKKIVNLNSTINKAYFKSVLKSGHYNLIFQDLNVNIDLIRLYRTTLSSSRDPSFGPIYKAIINFETKNLFFRMTASSNKSSMMSFTKTNKKTKKQKRKRNTASTLQNSSTTQLSNNNNNYYSESYFEDNYDLHVIDDDDDYNIIQDVIKCMETIETMIPHPLKKKLTIFNNEKHRYVLKFSGFKYQVDINYLYETFLSSLNHDLGFEKISDIIINPHTGFIILSFEKTFQKSYIKRKGRRLK